MLKLHQVQNTVARLAMRGLRAIVIVITETKLDRSARPLVDHYPRTKSEDDAVGAPRLVFGR